VIKDVYGLMGLLSIPIKNDDDDESEEALFLAVIVDCKSVGKLDVAEIFSISVAGKSTAISYNKYQILFQFPASRIQHLFQSYPS
jgi:hypothetical protein